MRLAILFVLLLVFLCLSPRQTQAIPARDTYSLSVGFPGGGNPYLDGGAGIWWMMDYRINLGLNAYFNYKSDDSGYTLDLGPAVRRYLNASSQAAPFFFAQVTTRLKGDGEQQEQEQQEDGDGIDVDAIVGFGVEWFAARFISFAAHVGVRMDLVQPGEEARELETLTSQLCAQLYF